MNRTFPSRPAALVAVLALAAAALAAGCAKKVTSVDAGFTQLEGRPDPRALIMVYPELTPASALWRDYGDKGVGTPGSIGFGVDVKLDSSAARPTGSLHVLLLDGTPANGYELYRTAANGGLQRIGDFVIDPALKWLDTQWEVYSEDVAQPSGYVPTYIGRGLLSGVAGRASPLTNPTTPSPVLLTPNIMYTDSLTPADSLFRMSWTAVPGSAGYWLQVYQFSPRATIDEQMRSGQPAPIWDGNVTNAFVGYVAAPATSYRLGDPGALVLKYVPPVHNRQYRVRITGVDSEGRITGYLQARDFLDDGYQMGDTTYVRYPLASVTVTPNTKNPRYDHIFE